MPADGSNNDYLLLPRLGAVIAGAALIFPALRLPLVFACLAGLGSMAMSREGATNAACRRAAQVQEARPGGAGGDPTRT